MKKWNIKANKQWIIEALSTLHKIELGIAKWPIMEKLLYNKFKELQSKAKPVWLRWFIRSSKILFIECYSQFNAEDFCCSSGWLNNFFAHNRISIRRPTNHGQQIP